MSSKHQDFAKRVLEAFAAAGCHTDKEVAEFGGPSSTTMTSLRKAAVDGSDFPSLRSDTLRRIDRAAMWRPNGARELWLNGTEPTLQERYPDLVSGEVTPRQKPGRQYGLDGYVEVLASRILELEERVDLLEMDRIEKGGQADGNTPAKKSSNGHGDGGEGSLAIVPNPSKGDDAGAEEERHLAAREVRRAARKGKSQGRQLRKDQDDAETGSQVNPNDDGTGP